MTEIRKNFIIAIPGRLESSRLPNKLLLELGGKSIITRVLENCLKAFDRNKIIFCTDSEILSHKAKELNIDSIITKNIIKANCSLTFLVTLVSPFLNFLIWKIPNLITAKPPKTSATAIINPLNIFTELASFDYYL